MGRDGLFWPPNQDRNVTLDALLGPLGTVEPGCLAGEGLTGLPDTSDPWSQWLDAYFGRKQLATSNVVFSNGLLDPWSSAGVFGDDAPLAPGPYGGPLVQNISVELDLMALILPLGAHHLDLMFMDDNDPPDATNARAVEWDALDRWFAAAAGRS